jgi:hypothetical protein
MTRAAAVGISERWRRRAAREAAAGGLGERKGRGRGRESMAQSERTGGHQQGAIKGTKGVTGTGDRASGDRLTDVRQTSVRLIGTEPRRSPPDVRRALISLFPLSLPHIRRLRFQTRPSDTDSYLASP